MFEPTLFHTAAGLQRPEHDFDALGNIGVPPERIGPVLLRAVEDKDPGVRAGAVGALGLLGGPPWAQTTSALRKALEDRDDWVRYSAVVALGRIGPPARKAVGLLTKLVDDDRYWTLRKDAAKVLRKIQADPKRP